MNDVDDLTLFDHMREALVEKTIAESNEKCRAVLYRLRNNMNSENIEDGRSTLNHALDQGRKVRYLNNLMKATSDVIDIYVRSVDYSYDHYKESHQWPRIIWIIRISKHEKYLPSKCFYSKGLKHVIFENESRLKSIEPECFLACRFLVTINLPDSVSRIGESSFKNCQNLRWIKIPTKLKYIEKGVFHGCSKLYKTTIIPSRVFKIFYDLKFFMTE